MYFHLRIECNLDRQIDKLYLSDLLTVVGDLETVMGGDRML